MAKLPNIIERERSLWTVVKFVFIQSLRGSRRYSIMRYISSAIGALFLFAQFGAAGIIVNEFVTQGIAHARTLVLVKGFALLILSEVIPALVTTVNNFAWNTQGNDMNRHLQSLFFKKMNQLDIGTIEQPELQNMYEVSTNRGWSSFIMTINIIADSVKQIVALVFAAIAIFVISPTVFFIIFIGSLPIYFIERSSALWSASIHKKDSESGRVWKTKVDAIHQKNTLIEIKNFGIVDIFRKKFLTLITAFHEKMREMYKKKMINDFIGETIIVASFIISFYILIHNVQLGTLAVGSLVFSFGIISRFQSALSQMFSNFGKASEYKKNIDTMLDFLETEPLIISGPITLHPDEFQSLEIRNISFRYPGTNRDVIRGMSLVINRGNNIAIVGLNGAGKTTLLKLITRVYDPTSGEILINGINLKEYNLESWKRCLGILLQEYSLYAEETIAENIMLGDISKHDQSLVQRATRETPGHEYIHGLAEKYNQRVGTEFEGGVELSKGQKQKVALARVFYRNAPIVILDEPTAAIDALSEDTIFRSLRENHTNQTRIIISHKFSNVRDADTIIMIQNGTILEQGSHDELMDARGTYRELFELQAEGYK